jgi:hypothetical protein
MKTSRIIPLLVALMGYSLGSPFANFPSTLGKRSQWSITPYNTTTCDGPPAYVGASSNNCINFEFAPVATGVVRGGCNVTLHPEADCHVAPGMTLVFAGDTGCFGAAQYHSARVFC